MVVTGSGHYEVLRHTRAGESLAGECRRHVAVFRNKASFVEKGEFDGHSALNWSVTEPPPNNLASQLSSTAWAQAQADGIVSALREQALKLREMQSSALSSRAEASSQDGSVRAVVDASGVVLSLDFAPSVFARGTPDKLARTTVATIQAAAAKARAQVGDAMRAARADNSGLLADAAEGAAGLGLPPVEVPSVPHTVADPTARPDQWSAVHATETVAPQRHAARETTQDGDADIDFYERPW
jgi:DNA-binding protein YbaB